MPNDFQYDVFLSHSAKDKAVVRPLAERLRTRRAVAARRRRKDGPKVWLVAPQRPGEGGFDEWVLQPGDSIPAKIDPPSLRSYGGAGEGLQHSNFGLRTSDSRGPTCRPMRSARTGRSWRPARLVRTSDFGLQTSDFPFPCDSTVHPSKSASCVPMGFTTDGSWHTAADGTE